MKLEIFIRVQEEKQKQENANIDKFTGPFLQAVTRNRNGRVYPQHIIEREVAKYQRLIESHEAVGELSHSDYSEINQTPRHELNTGLTADEYGEISIDTYHDDQYSIQINDDSSMDRFRKRKIPEPHFLTFEEFKSIYRRSKN